jgi:flavin-dependent dehydrogenase
VNSRVRRSFLPELFDRPDWNLNVASAFEVHISRETAKKNFDHPVIFYGFVDWGYAWIFPNKEGLKVGICGLKRKNNKKIISLFKDFLSEMDLQDNPYEKINSYVLPYGSFLPSPYFRNVLMVGDAAGFADPFLGEGIFYAQRSAELAARAILSAAETGDTIKNSYKLITNNYMCSLKEHIYPELVYAGKIQEKMFTFWNKFNFFPLKVFLAASGEMLTETVQGIRSYRWMKKL